MPKLRNASTDLGKMSQYLARKCVIHSPQAELDLNAKELASSPRFGTKAPHFKGATVKMIAPREAGAEPNEFVAISPKGRAIKVTLEEIDPSELDTDKLLKVGT